MTQLATPEIKSEAEALALGLPVFKFVAEMKAMTSSDGAKRVHLTASSNATDLTGDVMSEKALRRMQETAIGKTMFLNHDTTVPESVFGAIEDTQLVSRSVTVQTVGEDKAFSQMPLICLEYDVIVEESNPRAVKTWEIINGGRTQLGASVTIAVIDKTRLKDGRTILEDVYHLETSVVGVPCNQTAWLDRVKTKSFALAAKKAARRPDPIVVEIEEGHPIDAKSLAAIITDDELEGAAREFIVKENATMANNTNTQTALVVPDAKAIAKFKTMMKDLFSDKLEEYLENPFFYVDRLIDAICELCWWNYGYPVDQRMAAANEMLDAFKISMLGVFEANFTEQMAHEELEVNETVRVYSMRDKMQKAVDAFYKSLTERVNYLAKAGARNSKSDKATIEKIHKSVHDAHTNLVSLGMECKGIEAQDDETDDADEKSITIGSVTIKYHNISELEEGLSEFKSLVDAHNATLTKNSELEASVASLTTETKTLTRDSALWKARYQTAVTLAEKYANLPAARPGQLVNPASSNEASITAR